MKTPIRFVLMSLLLTLLPSSCCMFFLAAGNLEKGKGTALALGINAAVMGVVAILVGLGTSILYPRMWMLLIGTQFGWFGGYLAVSLVIALTPNADPSATTPFEAVAALIGFGLGLGLLPALMASFIRRPVT